MFAPGKRRVTAYVIFHGSFLGGFWTFTCPPAWRHCLMLVALYHPSPNAFARRYTLRIEVLPWGLDYDVLWQTPEEVAEGYYKAGVTAIVRHTVELPPARMFAFRGVITCVSVLKAALAIKNWRIITPKQLFKHLIRDGGELVTWEGEADADVRQAESSWTG